MLLFLVWTGLLTVIIQIADLQPVELFTVIVAFPEPLAVTRPVLETVATDELLVVHVIFLFAESGVIVGVICTVLLPELKSIIISVCDNIISFGLVITVLSIYSFIQN